MRSAGWGGEEFLILLPNTRAEDALVLADRIRHSIQDEPFMVDDKPVHITVSVGISDTRLCGLDPQTLVKAADEALYKAKRTGRNRTVLTSS